MSLIKSISGIRGTIGGKPGDNLSPIDIVKFTASFICFIKEQTGKKHLKLTVGRDARISGDMVNRIVCGTAMSMGCDVYDLGLSTTPTVEMEVIESLSDCGIIITASHNPAHWNALKLLNNKGEFISAGEGNKVLKLAETQSFSYSEVTQLGSYQAVEGAIERHIAKILALPLVDIDAIKKSEFQSGHRLCKLHWGHRASDVTQSTGRGFCSTVELRSHRSFYAQPGTASRKSDRNQLAGEKIGHSCGICCGS